MSRFEVSFEVKKRPVTSQIDFLYSRQHLHTCSRLLALNINTKYGDTAHLHFLFTIPIRLGPIQNIACLLDSLGFPLCHLVFASLLVRKTNTANFVLVRTHNLNNFSQLSPPLLLALMVCKRLLGGQPFLICKIGL